MLSIKSYRVVEHLKLFFIINVIFKRVCKGSMCTVHIFTKFSDLVASKWGVTLTIAYILKLKPFRLYNERCWV